MQEILIRTAVQPPGSIGWVTNPAGLEFNHDFGAGLIDATAAVNLAATWANLPTQTSTISSQTAFSAAIPNNSAAGTTRTFDLSASNIRIEHVTLTLSATHTACGNLEITLTSPGGMASTPAAGQIFSPGTTVSVDLTVTDLTVGGTAGTVTQVELFDNDVSLGIDTTPNIGSVGSTKSAYFAGNTDTGADLAANWRATTSLTARAPRALLPGVTLSGGSYSQNFNTTPGPSGTAYPDGWTSYNDTTADVTMLIGSATSATNGNYNYGSRVGLLGSDNGFDPSSLVLALAKTESESGLKISFDIVRIREQGRSMTFQLQYSTTSATAGFTDVPNASYTSANIAEGTVTKFSNIALPTAIANSATTVYLRWLYATLGGSGSRDGIALDNVVVSTSVPALTLTASPTTFAENLGAAAATGTVSISSAPGVPLILSLASSDTTEATVPPTVTIAAG